MDRLITDEDLDSVRKTKIFKLFNLFWSDREKRAILENLGFSVLVLAAKFRFIREEILDDHWIITIETDKHTFMLLRGSEGNFIIKNKQILYRKNSYKAFWDEIVFPPGIAESIQQAKDEKQLRQILNSAIKMVAFW